MIALFRGEFITLHSHNCTCSFCEGELNNVTSSTGVFRHGYVPAWVEYNGYVPGAVNRGQPSGAQPLSRDERVCPRCAQPHGSKPCKSVVRQAYKEKRR